MNEHTPPLVPVRTGWFKSSRSNPSQNCVEIRLGDDQVMVRDSKEQDTGPVITVTARQWAALITMVATDTV